MKQPTFLEGAAVALAASLAGSAIFSALAPGFPVGWVTRLLIAGLSLGYILYLLNRNDHRVGRVTVVATWVTVSGVIWLLDLPLVLYGLVHLGGIWLVRSLYFYSSLLSATADMGVVALGLVAAIWAATQSGSVFLVIWSFFLVQALFVAIPRRLPRKTSKDRAPLAGEDRFQCAYRAAEAALRRLSSTH